MCTVLAARNCAKYNARLFMLPWQRTHAELRWWEQHGPQLLQRSDELAGQLEHATVRTRIRYSCVGPWAPGRRSLMSCVTCQRAASDASIKAASMHNQLQVFSVDGHVGCILCNMLCALIPHIFAQCYAGIAARGGTVL